MFRNMLPIFAACIVPLLLASHQALAQAESEASPAGWLWLATVVGGPIILGLVLAFGVVHRRRRGIRLANETRARADSTRSGS